ncbi:MAG: lysophospholipid acyltransferase family protein [Myxococcota bacterium]
MKPEKRGVLESAAVAAGFAALTIGYSLAAVPAVLVDPDRGAPRMARRWAKRCLGLAGVDVEIDAPPDLGPGPYVVMANHTSHFDVVALYGHLPIGVRFVAKKELSYIPVFGWVLALGAAIIIDRKNHEAAVRSLDKAGQAVAAGASVLLFPEGTRTPPGHLGDLKKGPFHLALAARVPVLPVGIEGSGDVLAKGDWHIRRGHIRIRIGTPIPTTGYPEGEAGRAALMADVAKALEGLGHLQKDAAQAP